MSNTRPICKWCGKTIPRRVDHSSNIHYYTDGYYYGTQRQPIDQAYFCNLGCAWDFANFHARQEDGVTVKLSPVRLAWLQAMATYYKKAPELIASEAVHNGTLDWQQARFPLSDPRQGPEQIKPLEDLEDREG